jgi:hypothetical protein
MTMRLSLNTMQPVTFSHSHELLDQARCDQTGLDWTDRCLFVEIYLPALQINARLTVNLLQEHYPKHSLDFAPKAAVPDAQPVTA